VNHPRATSAMSGPEPEDMIPTSLLSQTCPGMLAGSRNQGTSSNVPSSTILRH
jgi:hypothetical protein